MELEHIHFYFIDLIQWILHLVAAITHRLAKFILQLLERSWFCGYSLQTTDDHLEVSHILFRNTNPFIAPFQATFRFSLKYFATWHQSFEPLNYLNNPCISLCHVKGDFVYFLEIENTLKDELYNTRKHPFFELGLWNLAHKIIKVPKPAFMEYTKEINLPKSKIVYCAHSVRCGSTALVQAINSLDNWVAIAELSWAYDIMPTSLSTYDEVKKYATSNEFRFFVAACIKAHLSNFPDDINIFWKTHLYHEPWIVPTVKEFFPSIKIMYMTRRSSKAVDSHMKNFPNNPWFDLNLFGYNCIPNLLLKWSTDLKVCRYALTNGLLTPETHKFLTDGRLRWYEIMWLRLYSGVSLCKKLCGDVPLLLIDYDAFMDDLETSLTKVFEYLDIPLSDLQSALNAYKFNSQSGSIFDGCHRRAHVYKLYSRDADTEAKCTAMAEKLGIPPIQRAGYEETF